jgi:hypothetical protein
MLGLLHDLVANLVCWIETAGIFVVNGIITALAVVVSGLLALLPGMPTLPAVPAWLTDGFSYASYFFPVTYAFDLMGSMVVLWLAWFGVAIALRWARAIGGA